MNVSTFARWGCCLLSLSFLSGVTARGQLSLDREPTGPSSRKTGLVITEIMYHPRPVPGLTNRLQFIELFNSKPWDEDIGGFSIDGTARYTFAPNTVLAGGAYLVLARDPGFVRTNYSITNVTGPWIGAATNGLSIDRGTIQLRNRQGAVLLTVNYSDAPPWPVAADGSGHSIVLARPSFGEDDARAWAESDVIGGSPGVTDPVPMEPLASIVINEWMAHTDLPLRDSIELYNHGNVAVDLSGAYLSDTPDTNRYRIPDGTIIGPRGFRSFDDSVMPFSLFAEGETIFLVNSNQNRVIDAINFKGMSNSVSAGRYPDGGPLHYSLATRTFGTPNSKPKRWAVVINEIMYNPISGDVDDEYVEIYNRTASAFNLSAWSFTNGINYTFPNGASIPAGAYWVVARNPSNLFSIYTNLSTANTFGPYTGTLANGGERLSLSAADYDTVLISNVNVNLRLNVLASEVEYGDGGRWGNWSDGGGASLELIDPEADTFLPSNWADSDDTGESLWTAIESTVPLGETLGAPVNDSLIIIMQGIGECLVDEVEVRVNGGPNLVANGGFEAGLNHWSAQGSHDFSTIENTGFVGTNGMGHSLHVRAGSRGENQSNRIISEPFAGAIPAGATVSIRAKVKWLRGHPEILLRLHGGGAEAYGMMALPKKLGTPGAANSRRVANAGPAIYDVKHAPLLPAPGEPVVVSARAVDPQGVGMIALRYRVDPNPAYTDVAMRDDGTGGDEIADDGIYSATIPAQSDGVVAPFFLEAHDTTTGTNTFPQDVFPPPGLARCWPNDAVTRECLVRWGETQMPGDFATYHLWISAVNSNRWHTRDAMNNTAVDGTFVYNNARVVYNALPLYSGSPWHRTNSTTGPAGANRVDYEMNFPGDDPLLGTTDFILNNPGNADTLAISDLSAVAEQTVYRVMEGMGLIQNHRRYIHFFVNGSQRSTTPQRLGNFIFEDSQQPSGDMIDQWFPNDAGGQLFKVEDWFEFQNNGFDIQANNDADLVRRTIPLNGQPTLVPAPYRFMFRKRSIGVGNSANDYSQIFALIDAASPVENPTNTVIDPVVLGAVADWEQWMRIFSVQRAVGNWDSYGWARGKNDYWYKPAAGLFQHMTWDIDYSLGLGRPWNEPLFDSNDPRVAAMFNTPEIVRAYWRGFTDLIHGPFNNATLDPFIDARIAALTANDINIDSVAVDTIKTYISDRRGFLLGQLATVATVFAVDGPPAYGTTNNLIVISGSAPVEVKTITLNGTAYPITWTSVTNFTVRVVLQPGFNTYTLQGFDPFGVAIAGANQVLNVEYTGPVADPVGSLILSEIMFAPDATGGQFLEIMNLSPLNFDLSGWRLEGVNVTFPAGSIVTGGQILVVAQNRNAFHAAYANVPVFAVFGSSLAGQGQILALVRPGLAGPEVVDGVRYETETPWPAPTNGVSLQLIDAAQDNGRFGNWALDLVARATPGASNSVAGTLVPLDPLWLNEIHIESINGALDNFGEPEPWLELYNSGVTPLSLDGWYLGTNYMTNLTGWPFPTGLVIGPGEHRLIWADGEPGETDGTNIHTSFRCDYKGKVALVRLVEGQPQIADYLTWRLPYANVSYGSYPDGQPAFRYVLQDPTPHAANVRRPLAVMVNEWMASNTAGLRDPADNARDDWFELYNGEPFTVDLSGFWLTDDPGIPAKFLIPTNGQYRIAPGGYLLVWADNQPAQNTPARADLHTNFKLASASGSIGLFAPDAVTEIDSISYTNQISDISNGRYTDGASRVMVMTKSTPGARNSATPGYNARPLFPTLADRVVFPGTVNTYSVVAYDPDLTPQTLSYSVVSAPAVSQISGGFYRWTVPAAQPLGDYLVTLRVTDSGTPPRSDVASFTITVRAPGDPVVTNAVTIPPVISAVSGPAGEVTFTIDTLPGRTYRVLYSDELSPSNWLPLDRDFVAANATASITDPTTRPHRFYRVQRLD